MRDRLEWACGPPYRSAAEVWNPVCWPLMTLACRMLCHLHAVSVLQGQTQRHVSSTQMNKESSRSHLIMSVIIEATNLQTQNVTRGKLSFVDLAGSERCRLTQFRSSALWQPLKALLPVPPDWLDQLCCGTTMMSSDMQLLKVLDLFH